MCDGALNKRRSRMLNMVTFAPIPSESVTMTMAAKPGRSRSPRAAYRVSCAMDSHIVLTRLGVAYGIRGLNVDDGRSTAGASRAFVGGHERPCEPSSPHPN